MKAFTLIEVIVVTALTVLLMLVGTGLFIGNSRFYQNQKGEIAAVNATRAAADRVNELARGAAAVVSSRQFGATIYTTGPALVILRLPSVDGSGSIIASTYDYAAFGRDPGNQSRLLLIVDGTSGSFRLDRTVEITDKLSAISLTYDNADLSLVKQISYVITVTETGRYAGSEQVTGAATLRN